MSCDPGRADRVLFTSQCGATLARVKEKGKSFVKGKTQVRKVRVPSASHANYREEYSPAKAQRRPLETR